jgi:hypothetical protein
LEVDGPEVSKPARNPQQELGTYRARMCEIAHLPYAVMQDGRTLAERVREEPAVSVRGRAGTVITNQSAGTISASLLIGFP